MVARIIAMTLGMALAAAAMGLEIPDNFVTVRASGMGGAFTAVANDEDAVWANPAGVSRVRKARSRSTFHRARFPNIIAGSNTNAKSFYQSFASQEKSVSEFVTESDDVASGGEPFWVMGAAFPFAMFDFNDIPTLIGAYSSTRGKIVIDKDTPDAASIESISDAGGVLSIALPNRTNRFSIGVTVRSVARYAFEDVVPSDELTNKEAMQLRFTSTANQTTAIAVDAGMIFTLADFWYPTIGISVLNAPVGCRDNYLNPFSKKKETVCGTVYTGTIVNESALSTVDPTDIRVGFSITPRLSRTLALRLAVDAHHIHTGSDSANYGLQGIEAQKLLHGGAELFIGNPLLPSQFALRAGFSQGFFSAGASVNAGVFTLAFATYGRDVSSSSKAIEDRRMVGQFSFEF